MKDLPIYIGKTKGVLMKSKEFYQAKYAWQNTIVVRMKEYYLAKPFCVAEIQPDGELKFISPLLEGPEARAFKNKIVFQARVQMDELK